MNDGSGNCKVFRPAARMTELEIGRRSSVVTRNELFELVRVQISIDRECVTRGHCIITEKAARGHGGSGRLGISFVTSGLCVSVRVRACDGRMASQSCERRTVTDFFGGAHTQSHRHYNINYGVTSSAKTHHHLSYFLCVCASCG